MQILVIGGGRFVGRHFVERALASGHELTVFNRGKTSLSAPKGVEEVQGDRETDLDRPGHRQYDAVVDMCGYVPRVVKLSCDALAAAGRYLFISTISVYADSPARIDESSPREVLADPTTETVDGDTYGGLKALCEDVVSEAFEERALIVRPGMIVGPLDPTDRFTWWVARAARGGVMPAIGGPDTPMQFIDGRDQADWMLHALESEFAGTFNVTGNPTTLETVLDAAGGDRLDVRYLDPAVVEEAGVPPDSFAWTVPADRRTIWDVDITAATATGLKLRPIPNTVRDTVDWHRSRGEHEWKAGLSPDQEALLLAQIA